MLEDESWNIFSIGLIELEFDNFFHSAAKNTVIRFVFTCGVINPRRLARCEGLDFRTYFRNDIFEREENDRRG